MNLIPIMPSLIQGLLQRPFRVLGLSPMPTPLTSGEALGNAVPQVPEFSWLFLKMILAMIFVIALAIVIIRFIIPKITLNRSRYARTDLKIIDRIPLDTRKVLYVLQVEGRRLLISASDHHVGLIAELESDHDEED